MFSEKKFFDCKINIFVVHFAKAYLLYTCENVDNCEQPLSTLVYIHLVEVSCFVIIINGKHYNTLADCLFKGKENPWF